jgi:hypothetical protein
MVLLAFGWLGLTPKTVAQNKFRAPSPYIDLSASPITVHNVPDRLEIVGVGQIAGDKYIVVCVPIEPIKTRSRLTGLLNPNTYLGWTAYMGPARKLSEYPAIGEAGYDVATGMIDVMVSKGVIHIPAPLLSPFQPRFENLPDATFRKKKLERYNVPFQRRTRIPPRRRRSLNGIEKA